MISATTELGKILADYCHAAGLGGAADLALAGDPVLAVAATRSVYILAGSGLQRGLTSTTIVRSGRAPPQQDDGSLAEDRRPADSGDDPM